MMPFRLASLAVLIAAASGCEAANGVVVRNASGDVLPDLVRYTFG